jgi:hypothetical protein
MLEAVRLRVQALDSQMQPLTVRAGNGDNDRITTVPTTLTALLGNHLAHVTTLHQQDVAVGFGHVSLPHALARTYPPMPTRRGAGSTSVRHATARWIPVPVSPAVTLWTPASSPRR